MTANDGAEPTAEHSTNDEQNGYTFEEIIVECHSDEDVTDGDVIAIEDENSPAVSKQAKGSTMKSLQLGMGQSIQFKMNVEP